MTNPTGSFDVTHHPDKGYFPTLDSIKESSWTDGTPDLSTDYRYSCKKYEGYQ